MGLARELAERIVRVRYADLPEAAVHWSRIAVLDTLGVTLAGAREDARSLLDETLGAPSGGPSLVFGTRRRASALDAALINGTAAHALDFDNTASNMGGHVSAVMVPALVAAAEAADSSGRDLILAHAVGFETGRIGLGVNPRHSERGWHPTATLGVFAVTAACARLLGLDVEQTETALALGTSLAAGTKANFGTMTKPLHAGNCARAGLLAAMLASKGFTANPDAFEHKQGFFALFTEGGEVDVAAILDGWGESFDIVSPGASYKRFPCCYSTHSAIQAALDLVRQHGVFDPDRIARVDSRTSARALAHTDRAQPSSALEAKFSVQYCVSRALLEGRVALEHFDAESYAQPAVQSLLGKVHASPYTGPFADPRDRFDARVNVTLTDGRVLEARVDRPLGRSAENAIPDEDIDAKFLDCATRTLATEAAKHVCSRVWALESVASVRELTAQIERGTTDATTAGAPSERPRVAALIE